MKKINKKQKVIILISITIVIVLIGIIIGANINKINILSEKYNTANNGNLLPEYIKAGITLGGVTGTLEDLDTSDATAKPEDILYGKTAYVNGEKITGTYKTIGMLQVGDYVKYIPDTVNSYTLSRTYSGYDTDQTISQENLTWQVLSINDDGTVDLISSTPTTGNFYLKGALGYNNGVYLLNDISAKLYSNSSLGVTARSLNIEDIEKHMNNEGLNYIHTYISNAGVKWGYTKTYTTGYNYYPNLYAMENTSGINTNTVNTDGITQSESYYINPTTETASQTGVNGLTVTQTYYSLTMSNTYYDNNIFYNLIHNTGKNYWIATRYVDTYNELAHFGIRFISNAIFAGDGLFLSVNFYFGDLQSLRPIVTLKSNMRIGLGDGKSSSTAYEIIV